MRKKNKIWLPFVLFIGILVLSVGTLALARSLRSVGSGEQMITNQDEVPRITVEEAYEAVLNGNAVLVDTRSAAQFEVGRAADAINIPVEETEARLEELDPDTWVITYCT